MNELKVKVMQEATIELNEIIEALKQEVKNLTKQDYRNIDVGNNLTYEYDNSYHGSSHFVIREINLSEKDEKLVRALLNLINTYNEINEIHE